MGGKLMRFAPLESIRYRRKAAISFSVRPVLMKSNVSTRLFSAMRWAAMRRSISSGSFTDRSSLNKVEAGASSQGSFSFQRS